jgi:ankyrin repeat protein
VITCILDALPALLDAARAGDGCAAVHVASQYGQRSALAALLGRGADASLANVAGCTPLHTAFSKDSLSGGGIGGTAACVRLLLAAGADSGARRRDGVTPLMCAAERGDMAALYALLGCGADVAPRGHERRFKGASALHYAAAGGHEDAVAALLACGADADAQTLAAERPGDVAKSAACAQLLAPGAVLLESRAAQERAAVANARTAVSREAAALAQLRLSEAKEEAARSAKRLDKARHKASSGGSGEGRANQPAVRKK